MSRYACADASRRSIRTAGSSASGAAEVVAPRVAGREAPGCRRPRRSTTIGSCPRPDTSAERPRSAEPPRPTACALVSDLPPVVSRPRRDARVARRDVRPARVGNVSEDASPTAHPGDELLRVAEAVHAGEVSVSFRPGPTVMAKLGGKLLDIAEISQVPIESGCRMGMCGSDPVRIVEGEENLSPMRSAERRTLDRLGLGAGCRMACVSRVEGPVVVDPHPAPEEPSEEPTRAVAVVPELKTEIGRVVVIGAGVAGVTAAEELRRVLPDAELTLIGDEPYAFYNRMGITRLVSESVSIESLYLNRRDWAGSRRIDYRRGLPDTAIDRESGDVVLADRERIPYDRVVIATGAAPLVPPIDGFGAAGSFVLRTIDDAVQIQQHVRRHRCRTVVIVGAGLLGLEAAYYLTQLDLRVVMLDRSPWPLSRQLDEQAGALLWEMLHDLGIELLPLIEAERIVADELVTGVELVDGGTIDAELCLAATG